MKSMYSDYFNQRFSWKTTEPLGYQISGFKVSPINKLYYNKFPYKISFAGNINFRDIDFHSHLTDFLDSNYIWNYKTQYSTKSRNVYVTKKFMVEELIDLFDDQIKEIFGPLNADHLSQLQGTTYELEYRDKYWYNKYDTKIEFFSGYGSDNVNVTEMKTFISDTVEKYQWYDFGSDTWYNKYLYVTSEELDQMYPFLKINYGEVIRNIIKCKLLEK